MVFNFESIFGKKTEDAENRVSIDNASEIFKMFDEANVALTGEARDIINQATLDGHINQEDLERLLGLIKEADNADE